ncbi:MAG TPA: Ig-like domain-containing protein, partial [Caulobacteraceae bacterium]
VLANDADHNGQSLTAALAANGGPAHGTLVLNADGSFTYTPNAGYAGTDSFTYIASDSLSTGTPTKVTLNVAAGTPVTQAASYAVLAGQALAENAAHGVLAGDADTNGLSLTASLATNGGPAHGALALNADGSFTYTPNAGFSGTDSFTYIASDSLSAAAPTTVTLTVGAASTTSTVSVVPTAPLAVADTYVAAGDVTTSVSAAHGVLANDVDSNGLALAAVLATNGGPTHGTLAFNADGSFTYTPTLGYVGADSFTYIASDSLGSSAPVTVSLTVAAQDIIGGTGNDTYHVYNSADQVTVAAGTSNETVIADCNYVLPANIQNLVGHGTGALTLVGNSLANVITANSGADTLTGGGGADIFVVAPGEAQETITDFRMVGRDKIDISSFLAKGLNPTFTDYGSYSTVSFSSGETIKLLGVHASNLHVSGHYVV